MDPADLFDGATRHMRDLGDFDNLTYNEISLCFCFQYYEPGNVSWLRICRVLTLILLRVVVQMIAVVLCFGAS